jgi:hypothetical protein
MPIQRSTKVYEQNLNGFDQYIYTTTRIQFYLDFPT